MYDLYYQELVNKIENFDVREGNRTIEVSSERKLSEARIPDSQIAAWAEKTHSQYAPGPGASNIGNILSLLILSPEKSVSDAKVEPLPISKESLESVRKAWHLPTEFLRMLLSTMPMASAFSPNALNSNGCLSEGLMFRGGRSRDWNYCIATIHNPHTHCTYGIIHGLAIEEFERLKACLEASLQYAHHPALAPLILVEQKIHWFARLLERRTLDLDSIEGRTGMAHGFSENPERNKPKAERLKLRAELDYDLITQQLTGLAGTFSFCDLTFAIGLRSLELLEGLGEKLAQHVNLPMPEPLDRRITYLKGLANGAQASRVLLAGRTQAQVQTVYSLIGQRDAELTRRDSTDMRVIAAVTLFFLPGTFTATLFSTAFFDFQAQGVTQVVNHGFWVYWVVTVALTGIVMLGWYFASRQLYEKKKKASPAEVLMGEKEKLPMWNMQAVSVVQTTKAVGPQR